MLRCVRIWSLDLNKTLGADGLIATSCSVEVRRVVEEANGTFRCVLVEIDFQLLSVDAIVIGQADLLRRGIGRLALSTRE